MSKLNFPNGIEVFDYNKYGIYIPFIYYMCKQEEKMYNLWRAEGEHEHNDERYFQNRDLVTVVVNENTGQTGKMTESITWYLNSLCWNADLYGGINDFKMNDLNWIIQELSRDNEVIIGKYKITHRVGGNFGYWEDVNGNIHYYKDEYKLYCNDELLCLTHSNFEGLIEKIIEHAGGFESWKML